MKTRTGFVSNSSSSSFILSCQEDIDIAKRFGIKWYLASDLLVKIEELRLMVSTSLPSFMCPNFWADYEEELRELVKRNPKACITDPYDRNYAYEHNIELPIFAYL